jgi:transcription elongation factor
MEWAKALFGDAVQQCNQVYVFGNQIFKNGLMELSLRIDQISTRGINPTQSELKLFTECSDPLIVDASWREMVQFNLHDRIEVIAGQLRGLEGRLVDTEQRGTVVVQSTAAFNPQPVRSQEIRKKFHLGDRVKIISSERQGAEGFIVHMDEMRATLYLQSEGLYIVSEGIEVCSCDALYYFRCLLDFCSSISTWFTLTSTPPATTQSMSHEHSNHST